MDSSLEIKIIIPLIPLYRTELHHKNYVNAGVKEVIDLSEKLYFEIPKVGILKPTISLIDEYKVDYYDTFRNALAFEILVNPNVNILNVLLDEEPKEYTSDQDLLGYLESYLITEFENKVFYFLILSQIAKPGTIKSMGGDTYVNGRKRHTFNAILSIHRESLDGIKEIKWPIYKSLDIIDVWNWFNKNEFSFERASRCNTERAINSFTYLFNNNFKDIVLNLVWSLIGIETLYCSGKEGLSEQIFKKTQIFLGEITDYKKKLKQMYDFRSRLIHGDLDFPPNNFCDDPNPFGDQLYDSTVLAVAILTATLQKMVYEKRKVLNFKYTLE